MKRGWARTLALTSLLPLLGVARLRRAHGALVRRHRHAVHHRRRRRRRRPAAPRAVGAHAVRRHRPRRPATTDLDRRQDGVRLMIRQAISLNDPCMIDGTPSATTRTATCSPRRPPIRRDHRRRRDADRPSSRRSRSSTASTSSRRARAAPLLAVLPYDPTSAAGRPGQRRRRTSGARVRRLLRPRSETTAEPLTYVANPLQITAPPHGYVYGFVEVHLADAAGELRRLPHRHADQLEGRAGDLLHHRRRRRSIRCNRGPLFLISPADAGRAGRRPLRSHSRRSERHRVGRPRRLLRRSRRRPGPVLSARRSRSRRSA